MGSPDIFVTVVVAALAANAMTFGLIYFFRAGFAAGGNQVRHIVPVLAILIVIALFGFAAAQMPAAAL